MSVSAVLRKVCERLGSAIRACLEQYIAADQSDALKLPGLIAAGVEAATIVGTDQPVATDEAGHPEGVTRPLAQERDHFAFLVGPEFFDHQGFSLCDRERRRIHSSCADFSQSIHCVFLRLLSNSLSQHSRP